MMEEYRKYREAAMKMYQEQRPLRLELRGGTFTGDYGCVPKFTLVSIYLYISQAGKARERELERGCNMFLAHPCHFHELYSTELSSDWKRRPKTNTHTHMFDLYNVAA